MDPDVIRKLKQSLWIGGPTDSGKSTIARAIAHRYGASVYHYDQVDAEQIAELAKTVPEVTRFCNASMEERWIKSSPTMMFDFLTIVFPLRFPLVIRDLLSMPGDRPIIVEGFGLLPELVHPFLASRHQVVWFIPTEKFKWESMTRRGKPSFALSLSDPEKARMNLFVRDMLLTEYYRQQVSSYGYSLYIVDGSRSVDEMTDLADAHFSPYLATLDY